jgi:triosephosphate isomerase
MGERKPIIVGNWKMHKTISETRTTLSAVRAGVQDVDSVEIGVAPPFTALAAAAEVLAGSNVALAAQNMHAADKGAFTGEISPPMLLDAGVTHVILGHSERRALFGETDDLIAAKLRAALEHQLIPILCIGETQEQREKDDTVSVVTGQLGGALRDLRGGDLESLVVAYEPVWAIGTGLTATPAQAQQVHDIIRDFLSDLIGGAVAEQLRIQYGGSVKPDNAAELLAQPDIDGALIGGASLDADSFAAIVHAAHR